MNLAATERWKTVLGGLYYNITDKDLLTARTEGGRLVRFPGETSLIGEFVDLTITGATTWSLTGIKE